MKSLLIVAHGSRREASNQEVFDLIMRVTQLGGHDFDYVSAAFLENEYDPAATPKHQPQMAAFYEPQQLLHAMLPE